MGVYENFELIKDTLGYAHLSTEEIIAKGHLSETSIAQIDKKLEEARTVLCHFPVGYTYNENKVSYYRIALSEQFQVLKEYPAGTSILDFIALETEDIVTYMKTMSESITAMIKQKAAAPDADGSIRLGFSDITKNAVSSTLGALYNDNFFLFLVNCCFLQYVTELFVYSFYPFIALDHYKKILGNAFNYEEDTAILMPGQEGGLYDIAEFINYGIRMTAAFLDFQKELLQSDFDMLLMKDKLFAEYDTLQYLYLMESKDSLRDTYIGTGFHTHLMPVGVHAFNHHDVVNKILDENMPVREVYDINSVQDWFRYEFMYLAKGNVLYEYYGAAEPPVRCGESHLSGLTEPPTLLS